MKFRKLWSFILMIWPYLFLCCSTIEDDRLFELFIILYTLFTVIVYVGNIINAFKYSAEDYHKLAFYNMIIKLAHIPFYLLVFLVGVMFVLSAVVPALTFITPFIIFCLFIIDFFLMLTSSMYGINALIKARKEKIMTRKYTFIHILFHLIFVADVISSVMVYSALKKRK